MLRQNFNGDAPCMTTKKKRFYACFLLYQNLGILSYIFEELLGNFIYLLQNTVELLRSVILYCTLIFDIVFTRVLLITTTCRRQRRFSLLYKDGSDTPRQNVLVQGHLQYYSEKIMVKWNGRKIWGDIITASPMSSRGDRFCSLIQLVWWMNCRPLQLKCYRLCHTNQSQTSVTIKWWFHLTNHCPSTTTFE